MKGKALRRAIQTADALRVGAEVPLIVDTTELITPDSAKEMLKNNKHNRPINWHTVEKYAEKMKNGEWKLHAQGIVIDRDGDIMTGQKRLWAVIKSNTNVYMRVSRGNPKDTAALIDRGTPQSARDLSSRETNRMHSPIEASIARAMLVLRGDLKPSVDAIASVLKQQTDALAIVMAGTRGTKKTREVLMIIAALMERFDGDIQQRLSYIPVLSDKLRTGLMPRTAHECWGRGAAFSLAMEQAKRLVNEI